MTQVVQSTAMEKNVYLNFDPFIIISTELARKFHNYWNSNVFFEPENRGKKPIFYR